MAKEYDFVDGMSVKRQDFQNGGHVLKIGIKTEKLCEWLRTRTNDKGYVNIEIAEKRGGPDQYGKTHNAYRDTYVPPKRDNDDGHAGLSGPPAEPALQNRSSVRPETPVASTGSDQDDSLPF